VRFLRALSFFALLAFLAVLVSCSRDPNVRKQKFFENGQNYFQQGKLDEAAIEFRSALGVDPAFADAHYQLALVLLRKQQWSRANQELGRVLDLQPENYSAHFEIARLLIAAGDFPQAQEHVDWLLKTSPNDARSHGAAADLLAAQGRFGDALKEAQDAVTLEPTNGEWLTKLALIQLRSNQADAAEGNFKKATLLDPGAMAPRLMLANYYQARGRFAEAERQLLEAIRSNSTNPEPAAALARLYLVEGKKADAENLLIQTKPNYGDNSAGYRMLGDFYLGLGEFEKATNEYRSLYEEHSKDLQVKKNFTDLLIHTNQLPEAKKVDQEILKADPNDSDGLIFLGQLQIRDQDFNSAISSLQRVLKNDANNGLVHYELGVAYQKSGNLGSAENELRDGVRLRPDLIDAQRELAILAMRKNDMTTLEQTSSQIVRLRPGSAEGYALRAVSEINRQQFANAESDARKAIELAPSSAAGYVEMGNLRFSEKRFDEAVQRYRQALDRDPKSNDGLRGLMNTYVAVKRTDAAVAAANAQIAKVPDNSGFFDLLGTALLQQKMDLAGAKAALQKSLQLDPKNTDALMKLGQIEEASGQTQDAISVYEQGARDNPQEAGFYILLGQLYQNNQDWTRAADAYQKALAIRREDPIASCNLAYVLLKSDGDLDLALSLAQTARRRMPASPDAADTLGWIYYQKGAYRTAVDSLQAALTLVQQTKTRDNPRFHYHLGMAYAKSGETSRAREQLQEMLRMSPNSSDAFDAKQELSQLKS